MGNHAARKLAVRRKVLASEGEAGWYTTAADSKTLGSVRQLTTRVEYRADENADRNTVDEVDTIRVFCLTDPNDATYGGVDRWEIGDLYFRPGDYDPDGATADDRQLDRPYIFRGRYLEGGPEQSYAVVELEREIRVRQGRV